MTSSRSAAYFKRLTDVTSEFFSLQKMVKEEAMRNESLIEHAGELKRIYDLIDENARKGYIRAYLPNTDPLWRNSFVQGELQRNGFMLNALNTQSRGSIEWWKADNEKKTELK